MSTTFIFILHVMQVRVREVGLSIYQMLSEQALCLSHEPERIMGAGDEQAPL